MALRRCDWGDASERMRAYHDTRWGKPEHDDPELFALLVLEGMQAGLSWATILDKEDAIRAAFDGLSPKAVAAYGPDKVEALMGNAGIIRNRQKIRSAIANAQAFLKVQDEFGSFDAYLWGFTDGRVIDHHLARQEDMPAQSELSERVSADLRRRGFKFVGPVIVYSYLQATGIINDHLEVCDFRQKNVT